MVLIIAVAVALVAILSVGWYGAMGRWAELASAKGKDETMTERLLVSQVCFHMMPDSGFWGFGAGNFMACFPHYTDFLHGAVDGGIWVYAHEDYLQTIVEWGYVGAAMFGVIFFGGVWTGWRRLRGAPLAEEDSVLLTVVLIALAGVAVHAAFDFPLQIASIQLYVATYLGVFWASPAIAAPLPSAPEKDAGRSAVLASEIRREALPGTEAGFDPCPSGKPCKSLPDPLSLTEPSFFSLLRALRAF